MAKNTMLEEEETCLTDTGHLEKSGRFTWKYQEKKDTF